MAFLAIPSNDSNSAPIVLNSPPRHSAIQICSYVSVVTSFSSMMLALLLQRQYKARERGSAQEIVCCHLLFPMTLH